VFAEILDHFGRVDILVNNAGTNYRVPVLEYPEAERDRVINMNLKGYYLGCAGTRSPGD
jgi:NAD(P)-dependent dehydrogenase (short-subunit alcohol dehydrogenase family)